MAGSGNLRRGSRKGGCLSLTSRHILGGMCAKTYSQVNKELLSVSGTQISDAARREAGKLARGTEQTLEAGVRSVHFICGT